ncbi:MAG: hypothetical protein GY751_13615 [Bacteroidetes bacterium]|nr:hypothetical protein [Bacteroidota bacterium]
MDIKNATKEELIELRHDLLARHNGLLNSNVWIVNPVKDGIKNFIHHPSDGKISIVRAESEIVCSASTLFDYLVTDIDKTCKEWNNVMIYSGSIKNYGDGFELSRIVNEGHAIADREDVFIRCTGTLENGNIYEVSKGFGVEVEPMYTAISKYTQRSILYFASKEICPIDENTCLYKTIWHYDPSGWLSKLMPRKMLGKAILKNLVHEHQKIAGIFAA